MASLADNVAKVVKANESLAAVVDTFGSPEPTGKTLTEKAEQLTKISKTVGSLSCERFAGKIFVRVTFSSLSTTEGVFQVPSKCICDYSTLINYNSTFENLSSVSSFIFPTGFGSEAVYLTKMFSGCSSLTSLELPADFGRGAKYCAYMFSGCSSLTSVRFGYRYFGRIATSLTYMFSGCSSLTSFKLPETFGNGNEVNMSYMFSGCSSLTSLEIPGGFGWSAASLSGMFSGCSKLSELTGEEGDVMHVKVSFDLSPTILDEASLIRVLNSIRDVTSATTAPVLTLGTTLQGKLTSAEGIAALAAAKEKGWSIA